MYVKLSLPSSFKARRSALPSTIPHRNTPDSSYMYWMSAEVDTHLHTRPCLLTRSRLIVLSLPSDLSTQRLQEHFATLNLPITDAKVLHKKDGTSRRIGFVGFGSSGDAQKAKEWFDGTWLAGSRIKVDFAKDVSPCLPLAADGW